MKKQSLILSFITLIVINSLAKTNPEVPTTEKQKQTISFTENKGQVYDQNYKARPDVLYSVMAGNMAVHIKKTGVSYQLYMIHSYKEVIDERTKKTTKEIDQQSIYRIDLNWLNCNTNITKTEDETLEGYNNYYLESCPDGALNVKSYKGITLHNLYTGINLHYYEKNGELKHDYIVAAHADYKQIQLEVKAADITVNKDGTLLLSTPLGKVHEGAPIVYQNRKQLKAKWILKDNTLSFDVENYDPAYGLLIDPVTRVWGTYYGGSAYDEGKSCTTDAIGNVYIAGNTLSNTGTLIATTGSHQSTFGGGSGDAFLVKLNSSGVRQWGTYYGATGTEYGNSCATDASGNVYLAGYTDSNNNAAIATTGSHQFTSGGNVDAFLVKFDMNGVRQWGTFYGGTGYDYGFFCATDLAGDVYLTGYTTSNSGTVIATVGSHQSSFGGGLVSDAFLVKFNSVGVRQWGTYYGGTGSNGLGSDLAFFCTTDATGNVFMAGETSSNTNTVITTASSHQSSYGGGSYDAFLVKFNSAGLRQWATYYGGTGNDRGYSCAIDVSNNVYLVGYTNSNTGTVIATAGSHQSASGGSFDAFLVKFNSNGIRQWGTYYGGIGNDYGNSCAIDASGNIYLSGFTDSNAGTVISTVGSFQAIYGGGTDDAFFVKFNGAGVRQWGNYYGGAGDEFGRACVIDAGNNIYLTGYTSSNTGTAIASSGSYQQALGGGSDAFLVKFFDCAVLLSPIVTVNSGVCVGTSINFTANITGTASPIYTWSGPNSYTANIQNPSIVNAGTINIGIYTLTVNNGGCIETSTTQVTVYPSPLINIITTSSNYICAGQSVTLTAAGASTYSWVPAIPLTGVISPTITSTYTVTGTGSNSCIATAAITQSVDACTSIKSNLQALDFTASVFPNPSHGEFAVRLPANGNVSIYNVLGELVYQSEAKSESCQISMQGRANGVYFVHIESGNIKKVVKIIKN